MPHEITAALQTCLDDRRRKATTDYARLIARVRVPAGTYNAMDTAREILPLLDVLGIGEAQAIADLEAAVIPQGKRLAHLSFDFVYSEIHTAASVGIDGCEFGPCEGQPNEEFAALKRIMDLRLKRTPEIPVDERAQLLVSAGVPARTAETLAAKNTGWRILFWTCYTAELDRRGPANKDRVRDMIFKLGGYVAPAEDNFPQNQLHAQSALAKAARGIGNALAGKW